MTSRPRWTTALAAVPLLALLFPWAVGGEPGALAVLAGRVHPLLVHFPIALLLAAVSLELLAERLPWREAARQGATMLLLAGAWTAVATALTGLLLAREGGYDASLLFWHRWLGVGVALVAVAASALRLLRGASRPSALTVPGAAILTLLLLAAGHYGGSLAHGATFLTRDLPGPIGRWLGSSARETAADPLQLRVYDGLIRPALERRCLECHGQARQRGGLLLESREGLLSGGDGGVVLVAGRPDASEIVRRTTAAPWDPDVMPPEGHTPLSIGETELLRAWIASGASFDQTLGDLSGERLPSSVETLVTRLLPEGARRAEVDATTAPPADPAAVAAARRAGFEVRTLSLESPLLDVQAVHLGQACGDAELEALRDLAPQVAWLNLARTGITDDGLDVVSALPELRRLDLSGTRVSDAGVARLAGLAQLEILNLHGTAVSDASLEALAELGKLERLYAWSTDVTARGVERLREKRPELQVNRGVAEPGRSDP